MRRLAVTEKQEQQAIVRLLRIAGFTVYSTSQVRASMVSEGIPDLFCFRGGLFAWIECKARNASGTLKGLRPAQVEFMRLAQAAGQEFRVGGLAEAQDWLVELGLGQWTGNGGFSLRSRPHPDPTPSRARRPAAASEAVPGVRGQGKGFDASPGRPGAKAGTPEEET